MIFYGIVLLVVGIIIWAIGRATGIPPLVVIAGQVIGAIGLILLVVGIILLAIPAGGVDVRAMIA